MRFQQTRLVRCAGVAALAFAASHASADVMGRGQADVHEASVIFASSGDRLLITLANSSFSDVLNPEDVLTGVFFDIAGGPLTLDPESALLTAGSFVLWGPSGVGGEVGGEWAFRGGLTGAPSGAAYGISAAGLGLFGPHDAFPGANLHAQNGPQGLNYGLLSAGDDPLTGNTPVTGGNPLIAGSVTFTLAGLPAGFDLGSIRNVTVQYGTSLTEPSIPMTMVNVPAPSAGAVVAGGLLLALRRRRN